MIACDSGGPLETIVDGETGYLCPPDAREFAQRMRMLFKSWLLCNESRSASRRISSADVESHSSSSATERPASEEAECGSSELAGLRERLSTRAVKHSNERLGFPAFERTLHEVVGREIARVRASRGTSWIACYEFASEVVMLAALALFLVCICYLIFPAAMFAS